MWLFIGAVFLILLVMFPRGTLLTLVWALGAAGVLTLYLWMQASNEADQKRKVALTISYDIQACGKDKPIYVQIANNSRRIVDKVEWRFTAYKPGYSTNLVSYSAPDSSSDKILRPGQRTGWCFPAPLLNGPANPSALKFGARSKWITFRK